MYKRKIKIRMGVYAAYFVMGVIMMLTALFSKNDFLPPLGAAFSTVGILGFIKLLKILKNPTLIKDAEVSENDERNLYIYQRARSLSFTLLSILTAIGIIVSGIMKELIVMKTLSYLLCGALVIYLITYYVIKRKN